MSKKPNHNADISNPNKGTFQIQTKVHLEPILLMTKIRVIEENR